MLSLHFGLTSCSTIIYIHALYYHHQLNRILMCLFIGYSSAIHRHHDPDSCVVVWYRIKGCMLPRRIIMNRMIRIPYPSSISSSPPPFPFLSFRPIRSQTWWGSSRPGTLFHSTSDAFPVRSWLANMIVIMITLPWLEQPTAYITAIAVHLDAPQVNMWVCEYVNISMCGEVGEETVWCWIGEQTACLPFGGNEDDAYHKTDCVQICSCWILLMVVS